jgi:sporulation protein YlmC with PRC-barrel domain
MNLLNAPRLASLLLLLAGPVAGQEPARTPQPPIVIGDHRASLFQGMKVEDFDGEKLGTVSDFVVDLQSGEVKFALISTATFVPRLKIVPASMLSAATTKKETLALDVPKFRWKSAPLFHKSDLSRLAQATNSQKLYQFYALTPGEPKMSGKHLLAPTGRATTVEGNADHLQLASDLVGRIVLGNQTHPIGNIDDFLVDLSGERPVIVIISEKRLLHRNRRFALALSRVGLNPAGKLAIDANVAQFEQAPRFTQDEWQLAGAGSNQVYRYEIK